MTDAGAAVTRDRIEAELKDVLVDQFFVNADAISQDTHLMDDLELDSLDLMAALCTFEDGYSITVPNSEIPEMVTFGKCVDRLTACTQAAA